MSAMPNPASAEIAIEHSNKPAVLPILQPTIGPPMVDIRGLYREAGCYAYDPALGETAICRSAITYVDGDNGVLLYRGYPIADLVERCSYLEICWLLLNGELPTGGAARQIHPRHHPSHDGRTSSSTRSTAGSAAIPIRWR